MNTTAASETMKKTDVYIYANALEMDMLSQLIAGIEGEGASCEVLYMDDENAAPFIRTLKNANTDPGAEVRRVGGDGTLLAVYNGREKDFRVLGANAARYVKNMPLRLE